MFQLRLVQVAILFFLLFNGAILAQKNTIDISVNGGKTLLYANPGDIITFSIKKKITGKLTKDILEVDAVRVKWVDGHQWVATPGIHYFRRYIRWEATTPLSQVPDGSSTKDFMHKWVIIIVSGAENSGAFRHPSLVATAGELAQIQKNILIEGHPMKTAWGYFKRVTEKNHLNYPITPKDTINLVANSNADRTIWNKEGGAAMNTAIAWAVSGDKKFSEIAIKRLNAWAATNKSLQATTIDDYPYLQVTHEFDEWLIAADLLKYYKGHGGSGWAKSDILKFDKYIREVYAPMAMAWGGYSNGPWEAQNQNLNVYKSRMMVGVYLNDTVTFNNGYHMMFINKRTFDENQKAHGVDAINFVVQTIGGVADPGEMMEINRGTESQPDFGHVNMDLDGLQFILDLLWHQKGYIAGYDFYGLTIDNDKVPRIVRNMEWFTRGTLIGGPFPESKIVPTSGSIGAVRTFYKQKVVMEINDLRNVQQMYNHYHFRMKDAFKIPAEYVTHAVSGGTGGGHRDNLLHNRLNDGWEDDYSVTAIAPKEEAFLSSKYQLFINNKKEFVFIQNEGVQVVEFKLVDIKGKLVKSGALKKKRNVVSLKELERGVYLLSYKEKGALQTKKLFLN